MHAAMLSWKILPVAVKEDQNLSHNLCETDFFWFLYWCSDKKNNFEEHSILLNYQIS